MFDVSRIQEALPADIVCFSGCKDEQTSADVSSTAAFGLLHNAGPGGAGGACTNSMIKALQNHSALSWIDLLSSMRTILAQQGYDQIPQLSTSRPTNLRSRFDIKSPHFHGRRRALLVGINYVGTRSELRGCHNDVETMRRYIATQGFEGQHVHILMDNGYHRPPTTANLWDEVSWLVQDAGEGDSLFFHYSGHGSRMPDDNGDEASGWDDALVPLDYESRGLIRDDEVFVRLCAPLKAGVQMTCVMDCCHSATILDLPYIFKASTGSLEAVSNGSLFSTQPNPDFNLDAVLDWARKNPEAATGVAVVGGILGAAVLANMSEEQRGQLEKAALTQGRDGCLMTLLSILVQMICAQEDSQGDQ
eukprot:gnl/MRDRNA2_/MRDRNA2_32358_c0_seq1.p1 gnl/MRDRNA2_/MRDRNA2_32358_c0~~gnl/MRDRNA2_/MRDRNA2_32358_c0_seq1.p1  ORF type:complete len:362 (+),score=62.52 gnl/MRDRNA2_/MRDRNA2_32358_c0_seq1:85-1170(+)